MAVGNFPSTRQTLSLSAISERVLRVSYCFHCSINFSWQLISVALFSNALISFSCFYFRLLVNRWDLIAALRSVSVCCCFIIEKTKVCFVRGNWNWMNCSLGIIEADGKIYLDVNTWHLSQMRLFWKSKCFVIKVGDKEWFKPTSMYMNLNCHRFSHVKFIWQFLCKVLRIWISFKAFGFQWKLKFYWSCSTNSHSNRQKLCRYLSFRNHLINWTNLYKACASWASIKSSQSSQKHV